MVDQTPVDDDSDNPLVETLPSTGDHDGEWVVWDSPNPHHTASHHSACCANTAIPAITEANAVTEGEDATKDDPLSGDWTVRDDGGAMLLVTAYTQHCCTHSGQSATFRSFQTRSTHPHLRLRDTHGTGEQQGHSISAGALQGYVGVQQ